jgi:argininosuccinate lyase
MIRREITDGTFPFRDEFEDIHMNIEQRLRELVGETGGKLHTGRSRNDQVALDLRLYCLGAASGWQKSIWRLVGLIAERAEEFKTNLFPAWTHMQAAQPMSWGHYFLSLAEMLARDEARLSSFQLLHSVSPLGAGALSGSSLPLAPEVTAEILGFSGSFGNSYDVVGDRDALLELSQIAVQLMIHLSRWAEDFIYMASTPVGWIDLPDSLCTGSSMMPQKKNPDLLELTRGKTASVIGHCTGLMTLLKGLPTSYQRDLQQDKEHLFSIVDTVTDSLEVQTLLWAGLDVKVEKAQAALDNGFLMATELAEYLVAKGVPFRAAHHQVGSLVKQCIDQDRTLSDMSLDEFRILFPLVDEEVLEVVRPEGALLRRTHKGSTGIRSIELQLKNWQSWLDQRGE